MKKLFKEYTFILFGCFFLALGMNVFLVPMQLSSGGVSTISTIFYHIYGVPLSVTNLICNTALVILGYKFLGKGSVVKTIFGFVFLSVFLELTKHFPTFTEDLLVSTLCGGILVGLGVGLVVRVDGSTGGSDFAGQIVKRFIPHIPVATIILIIDCIIIAISGIIFKSYIVSFYSAVAMYMTSKVADLIINIGESAKSIYIISKNNEQIKDTILKKYNRGVTEIFTQGAFSKEERKMLLCVLTPKEAPKLVKEIKEIDPNSFVIINDSREVLGEGFKIS